jgi:hypothetical protein
MYRQGCIDKDGFSPALFEPAPHVFLNRSGAVRRMKRQIKKRKGQAKLGKENDNAY